MAAVDNDVPQTEFSVPREEYPISPTVLPWDRFSNWIHCACVVTFDLELGQAMEVNLGHQLMYFVDILFLKLHHRGFTRDIRLISLSVSLFCRNCVVF
jgi:hypothetical protein